MSKFKVGDKVRLKSLEKIENTYGITKEYLETMMGITLTISNVLDYSRGGKTICKIQLQYLWKNIRNFCR